jgi:hypothetical protein
LQSIPIFYGIIGVIWRDIDELYNPFFDIRLQHFKIVIFTFMVIEIEVLKSDKTVKFNPLFKVRGFIAKNRTEREIIEIAPIA